MNILAIAMRKAKTAARLSPSVWLLLPLIWTLLGLSRLLVLIAPFPAIARMLGRRSGLSARSTRLDARPAARALSVGRSIRLAARYCPWTANCFPQAITASIVLRSIGVAHIVFFGVRRGDTTPLEAHAWVEAGELPVVGGRGHTHFTAVAAFAFGRLDASDRT